MQKELIGLLLAELVPTAEDLQAFVARWRERVLFGELSVDDIVLSQSVKALGEYKERYTARLCSGKAKGAKRCGYDFGGIDIDDDAEEDEKCPRCGTLRKKASPPAHVRV